MYRADSVTSVTTDTAVTSAAGIVYGVHISYSLVTAGDQVMLRDGGASGTVVFRDVAVGARDRCDFTPPLGMPFASSIYVDISLVGGGTAYVTLVYS